MKRQTQGYALLAILLALIGLGTIFLINVTHPRAGTQDLRAQRDALRALYEARLALIAHGLVEDNTPGTLPSPSGPEILDGRSTPAGFTGTPGQAARRLPWHFLGLQATKGQECLWYVVNKPYRNELLTSARDPADHTAINPDAIGSLALNTLSVPAVAMLISPGPALAQQRRGTSPQNACQSGDVSQFLESSNAASSGVFINADRRDDFNDTALPLTHLQVLKPLLRRVLREFLTAPIRQELLIRMIPGSSGTLDQLRGTDPEAYESFDALLAQTDRAKLKYNRACAGVVSMNKETTTTAYTHPVSWLCFNDWYSHIEYHSAINESPTLAISLTFPDHIYHCALVLNTEKITCRTSLV